MTWTTRPVFETAPDGTCYELTGPEGAPCVVLIHGLGLSMRLWDAHLPALQGWRVLRYDLHGHGHSSPCNRTLTLAVFADQIAGLLDHVGIDATHIIGFSVGGMINRRFALDYPDRTLSLAILNSPHDRGADAQAEVERRALAARDQGAFATFDAALIRWFTPEYLTSGQGPELVRDWRTQVDDESYAQTSWVLAHGVRELIGMKMAVNAMVMTCENDVGSTPRMSMDIAAAMGSGPPIIVPCFKHLGLLEDPTTYTDAIAAFLGSD